MDPRSLSPAGWARYASNATWKMAAHHALLNRCLMDLAARRITRLMVEMPPRHGKSDLCSGYFPSWYLGLFPEHEVMLASYEAQFASRWGRRNRDLLDRHGPDVFGVRVRNDSAAKAEWLLQERKGGMSTAGVGGALTGKGAHLLIIDDPVKNADQANSATYRDRTWDWWESTASTRLQPDADGLPPVVLVIQTRWHEDDLAGRLLKGDEDWVRLSLPAIAERDEHWTLPWWDGWAWHREAGEALWPERFGLDTLRTVEQRVGSYWWNALYQQRPVSREGGILKPGQFRRYRPMDGGYLLIKPTGPELVAHEDLRLFGTMDLAASERTQSDWNVVAIFGQTSSGELLLLDVQRTRQGTQHADLAWQAFQQYRPAYLGVEAVAMQNSVVLDCRRGDPRTGRRPMPIRALKPRGDKVSRALTLARVMEGGQVFIPETASWLDDMLDEVRTFPRGKHDDIVDALAYGAIEFTGGSDAVLRTW